MLSCMFSGTGFKLEADDNGAFFIDRSGEHFEKILNYFRTGVFIPPTNKAAMEELKLEIEFYQIESLLEVITTKEFKFESINDKNGIIYWLATKDNTPWKCPVEINGVGLEENQNQIVIHPSENSGYGWCNMDDEFTRSITIHFTSGQIQPTSYSLSCGTSCHRPNNWKLDASDNGSNWVTLKNHSDVPFQSVCRNNWSLSTIGYYQYFRLMTTGPDASGGNCYCFHVFGFEVYGNLKEI